MGGIAGGDLGCRDRGVASGNDRYAILAGDRRAGRGGVLQMAGGVLLGRAEEAALLGAALGVDRIGVGRLGDRDIVFRLQANRTISCHGAADNVDVSARLGDDIAAGGDRGSTMCDRRRGALAENGVALAL